jgi:hypothetical protein
MSNSESSVKRQLQQARAYGERYTFLSDILLARPLPVDGCDDPMSVHISLYILDFINTIQYNNTQLIESNESLSALAVSPFAIRGNPG